MPEQNSPPSDSLEKEQPKTKTLRPWEKILVDIGPIALFMLSYNILNKKMPEEALYLATGFFMGTTLLSLIYAWVRTHKLATMPLVSGIFILILGSLTLIFHKSVFIKMKPTFVYLFFSVFIFASIALKRNIMKTLLGQNVELEEKAWKPLAIRWAIWFIVLAGLNELVWRNFSESQWVNFKFWIVIPLTFLFILLQIPYMMKHQKQKEPKETEEKMEKTRKS